MEDCRAPIWALTRRRSCASISLVEVSIICLMKCWRQVIYKRNLGSLQDKDITDTKNTIAKNVTTQQLQNMHHFMVELEFYFFVEGGNPINLKKPSGHRRSKRKTFLHVTADSFHQNLGEHIGSRWYRQSLLATLSPSRKAFLKWIRSFFACYWIVMFGKTTQLVHVKCTVSVF